MTTHDETGLWVGIDLGGTKMHAVLYDGAYRPLARRRKKTRGHEGADAGLERIAHAVEKLLDESGHDLEEVRGVGLGVPGPVDMEQGVIHAAPNLGWQEVPLREWLERKLGCPVAVCNDVDAGVYGEYCFGAGRGGRAVLGVFPGTGIGAGLIYEGTIYRGRDSSCLEIGHMPVVSPGVLCGCGRRGCLETVASRLSLAAEVAKAAYRGQAPYILRVAGTDLANIRSGVLAAAIQAGDQAVEVIVREGARQLGTALAGVANLLLPDIIVLGGGLVEALPQLYLDEVYRELQQRMMPTLAGRVELHIAELGDDAGVMGAAAWVRRHVQAQPPLATSCSH
ncbi:MAG: transcriptional regulator [Planctomycetaceae bacterium]|nr:MAG: transcriptional regulator [Planctomycetaceae bacterium]